VRLVERPGRGGLGGTSFKEEGPMANTRSTRWTFLGGLTAAAVGVPTLLRAQQRRVPYIIDISAADAPTANAAKSVREGQRKAQYVYRIFPGSATFGRNAVRYMTEIFREAGASPKRLVLMYSNDLFGKTQTDSFQAALKAANPGFEVVDVIPYPENAADLSTEVSRARAAKPDVLAPVTRPATGSSCWRSWPGSART
jgi:ABC-type branched-subunit amino acid transport system substrate-binding protein